MMTQGEFKNKEPKKLSSHGGNSKNQSPKNNHTTDQGSKPAYPKNKPSTQAPRSRATGTEEGKSTAGNPRKDGNAAKNTSYGQTQKPKSTYKTSSPRTTEQAQASTPGKKTAIDPKTNAEKRSNGRQQPPKSASTQSTYSGRSNASANKSYGTNAQQHARSNQANRTTGTAVGINTSKTMPKAKASSATQNPKHQNELQHQKSIELLKKQAGVEADLSDEFEDELDDEFDEDEEDWFDENIFDDIDEEDEGLAPEFEEKSPKRRKIQQTILEEAVEEPAAFKCGFVTLIGAPNVGKSTLLNQLVGENIAITSYRPQTTRNRIPGVFTNQKAQIIFVDTPGLHEGKSILSRFMGKIAIDSIADSDVVALLIEAGVGKDLEVGISHTAKLVLESLKDKGKKVFLIVNKIDRIPKEHILPVIAAYRELFDFQEIVPISGLTGNGIDELIELFSKYLPAGPALYPEDHLTDLPERFFASEMIREQLFRRLSQEVPYATAVTIDSWLDQGAGGIHIEATIHVERDSQKGIIIGKGGQQLKLIGTQARQKIERLLNTRVHLHLLVRVEEKWTHSEKSMKKLGYEDKK